MNDSDKTIIYEALRRDIQLFEDRMNSDGSRSWLLFDPVADKYYRFSDKEHLIITFLKSTVSEEKLLEKINRLFPSITQKDIRGTVSVLLRNNLLNSAFKTTEKKLEREAVQRKNLLFNRILHSYLFFRIPLWKPDRFLSGTLYLVQALCNKYLLFLLIMFSLCGYMGLIVHWGKFTATVVDTLNYSGLIKYGITIVFLKVLHEFSHAYAAKNAGIRVRRMGIGFIVFFPRFFTDLTDSWRLSRKKDKIFIDSAGIMAELIVGGIAVIFWLYAGPGIIRTVAYYIFAVSMISTVFVNGNPFIRYDGYYILMDAVNIDNLQTRSRMVISKWFKDTFFRIKTELPFSLRKGQKIFLAVYGVSSFIYRIFLYTGIILIVYYKFTKCIGIILVIIEVYLLIYLPLQREFKTVLALKKKAEKKRIIFSVCFTVFFLLIFFLPLPWSVSIPCVVGASGDKVIYIKQPGFLKVIPIQFGSTVKKGDSLMKLKNPFLKLEGERLNIKLKILETELDRLRTLSSVKMRESERTKIEQINNIKSKISQNRTKMRQLNVKSPIDGIFVLYNWRMKPGKWLDKGTAAGEVFSPNTTVIYAYAKEKNIKDLKISDTVSVNLNDTVKTFSGKVVRINPVPDKNWNPSPLLETAGGPLPVLKKKNSSSYIMKDYYYQITVEPEKNYQELKFSRTGKISYREFTSAGLNFLRAVISTLQRELAF
ncbi:MAG: HlyD family efflux transporter periplasmic adaptor subunit [Victivallales bacterium]|nr:HlyD family efflux transporter periplasmic adaptor subunit [Victivallales bacterium]MCF7889469.1 HlyD family efflux transporter periplasmic adaptor subunit [Victivallales bacterium]